MHWSPKYLEVVRSLDLNMAEDRKATIILDKIIKNDDIARVKALIEGRPVMIYGCGPSLENDLNKIWEAGLHNRFINVAVDGAVKALLEYNIVPHINVTDLDGDIASIVKANQLGSLTMVHAHSQSIRTILKVMPYLKGSVFGTTHSQPTEKVLNFGGFTDGDRAVYIVEHFKPAYIVLAGMDFGSVIGVYSGTFDPIRKHRGLMVGRMEIEELAAHTKTRIFNVTSAGENIRHVKPITFDKLKQMA